MQNRSNVATHQKKLLHNHLLKKVVKKCKLTKKATSQPATKKIAKKGAWEVAFFVSWPFRTTFLG